MKIEQTPLDAIVVEPTVPARYAVIWLHGLGDSGAGFAPIVPALALPKDAGIRFIFPHAPEQPVTINGGYIMRAWYDIKSMDLHDRADLAGVLESERQIMALIEAQIEAGIPSERILLAGFSQGGVMSLFCGLRFHQPLAGVMALSCYLPGADTLPEDCHPANASTPILQHHGEQDDVVPLFAGQMAQKALSDAGYEVEWQSFNMGHSVLPTQLVEIRRWILSRLVD
ncbi:alpha/beta hydrolase [Shewanella litorisediminis]|uniref:Dienelactone hydrolase family protein n=1 Tax=Shewanella litorisediminis TaxID=1173586 RepID=A0ABX7FZ43_9GAMM|nr:dienelactone hydrolase family protein [Shewanella litorisediminis]MCL2918720.1 alpha/beta hydrolase [Shewanella litorisediminis]QRH00307.1 dienelactone hydrolase family protein [Shewanella litorisediminis]